MRINIFEQLTYKYMNKDNQNLLETRTVKTGITGKNHIINSNGLNLGQDRIAKQLQYGRQKARKVIYDAFQGDLKIDNNIQAIKDNLKVLAKKATEYSNNIREIDERQMKMMKECETSSNDTEYKDLILLNRERVYSKYGMEGMLSDEDKTRLAYLKERGLTEFQKNSLENQEARGHYLEELNNISSKLAGQQKLISSIELDRLKVHTMVDAEEAAEEIMELTEKSILKMLVNEGVNQIEEEKKENEERIEEAQEEKEEEKLLSLSEKMGQKKEDVGFSEIVTIEETREIQESVKKIAEEMNLIMEDLKGLTINQNI